MMSLGTAKAQASRWASAREPAVPSSNNYILVLTELKPDLARVTDFEPEAALVKPLPPQKRPTPPAKPSIVFNDEDSDDSDLTEPLSQLTEDEEEPQAYHEDDAEQMEDLQGLEEEEQQEFALSLTARRAATKKLSKEQLRRMEEAWKQDADVVTSSSAAPAKSKASNPKRTSKNASREPSPPREKSPKVSTKSTKTAERGRKKVVVIGRRVAAETEDRPKKSSQKARAKTNPEVTVVAKKTKKKRQPRSPSPDSEEDVPRSSSATKDADGDVSMQHVNFGELLYLCARRFPGSLK